MITEIPASGFVLMAMCRLALLFWVALVSLQFVRPRFLLKKRAVPFVMLVLYFLTPLSYTFGHFALYRALGGLPAWGKVEGGQYFLGKAGGDGYVEVSHGVYSFFFWFELVGVASVFAMVGSAAILSWLGPRPERKAAAGRPRAPEGTVGTLCPEPRNEDRQIVMDESGQCHEKSSAPGTR